MPIRILFENGKLVRNGRPPFSAATNKKIAVITGLEDRRHILHGALQISNVLIDSFNRVIQQQGIAGLINVVNNLQHKLTTKGYKLTAIVNAALEDKIKEIITIAFGKEENLVAGFSVENQGIEKARSDISNLKSKLDHYCAGDEIRSLIEIKSKLIELIDTRLHNNSHGKVASYSTWILKILKRSIENAKDEVAVITLLNDFEFSCTLDILHRNVSKAQNIWGLTMAGKLRKAISDGDEQAIYEVLF